MLERDAGIVSRVVAEKPRDNPTNASGSLTRTGQRQFHPPILRSTVGCVV
jgi:hypothetical protein